MLKSSNEEQISDDEPNIAIPPVLLLHDVGYLDFDKTSHMPVISQLIRTEMITRGSPTFQNKDAIRAVAGVRFLEKLSNKM